MGFFSESGKLRAIASCKLAFAVCVAAVRGRLEFFIGAGRMKQVARVRVRIVVDTVLGRFVLKGCLSLGHWHLLVI